MITSVIKYIYYLLFLLLNIFYSNIHIYLHNITDASDVTSNNPIDGMCEWNLNTRQ